MVMIANTKIVIPKSAANAAMDIDITGERMPNPITVTMSFNSSNVPVILIACIVILVSWIMAEGHKLQEEHEYTV